MKSFTDLPSVPSDHLVPSTDQLLAVAAYLARFKGASRYHTESDLRCYVAWCAEHGLDPLLHHIVESGLELSGLTHRELLQHEGLYARLYEQQFLTDAAAVAGA